MLASKEARLVRRTFRNPDCARGRLSVRDVDHLDFEDVTPQHSLLGQSALQAYRSDINPGAPDATHEDQAAILVATLLRQSLTADEDSRAGRIRDEAVGIARKSLGDEMLS